MLVLFFFVLFTDFCCFLVKFLTLYIGTPDAAKRGSILHDQIRKRSLDKDVTLTNVLVRMYVRCGEVKKGLGMWQDMLQTIKV